MDDGETNPALLRRLGDWNDHAAWSEFVARYEPLVRTWCRPYGLGHEETAELCQRIWIELARRMGTFRYDPGRTFRGWLRTLCRSRAIDLIRERRADRFEVLSDEPWPEAIDRDEDDGVDGGCPVLLRAGQRAHDAVKARVGERTWRIFWAIAVEDRPVGEAAAAVGMSYAAAFAAKKRVSVMLRDEGRRLLAEGAGPAEGPGAAG